MSAAALSLSAVLSLPWLAHADTKGQAIWARAKAKAIKHDSSPCPLAGGEKVPAKTVERLGQQAAKDPTIRKRLRVLLARRRALSGGSRQRLSGRISVACVQRVRFGTAWKTLVAITFSTGDGRSSEAVDIAVHDKRLRLLFRLQRSDFPGRNRLFLSPGKRRLFMLAEKHTLSRSIKRTRYQLWSLSAAQRARHHNTKQMARWHISVLKARPFNGNLPLVVAAPHGFTLFRRACRELERYEATTKGWKRLLPELVAPDSYRQHCPLKKLARLVDKMKRMARRHGLAHRPTRSVIRVLQRNRFVFDEMVKLLMHPRRAVQRAARAVLKGGRTDAILAIWRALDKTPNARRKARLAALLTSVACQRKRRGTKCRAERARLLRFAFESRSKELRLEAIRWLSDLELLQKALEDKDTTLRWAAVRTLSTSKTKGATKLLRRATTDRDYYVRRDARAALLEHKSEAVPLAKAPALPFGLRVAGRKLSYRLAGKPRSIRFRKTIVRVVPNRQRPLAVVITGDPNATVSHGPCAARLWLVHLPTTRRRRLALTRHFRFMKLACPVVSEQLASWSPDGALLVTQARNGQDLVARPSSQLARWIAAGAASRTTRLKSSRSGDCANESLFFRGWIGSRTLLFSAFNHSCGGSSRLQAFDFAIGRYRGYAPRALPKGACKGKGTICVADLSLEGT